MRGVIARGEQGPAAHQQRISSAFAAHAARDRMQKLALQAGWNCEEENAFATAPLNAILFASMHFQQDRSAWRACSFGEMAHASLFQAKHVQLQRSFFLQLRRLGKSRDASTPTQKPCFTEAGGQVWSGTQRVCTCPPVTTSHLTEEVAVSSHLAACLQLARCAGVVLRVERSV